MYSFTSIHRKYTIYGAPVDGEPDYIIPFEPTGSTGIYVTNDEELAKKLRSHPEFGKKFMEIGLGAKENPNIISGIRSSTSHPELGEKEQEHSKLIEFGKLQATLLKKDGSYRKDASEEDKQRYEVLKQQLGE